MSEAEAREADDATPDGPQGDSVVTHDDDASDAATHDVSEDQPHDVPAERAEDGEDGEDAEEEPAGPEPSWWHRSHPTFAGLVGFFTGVAYVIIVPGVYAALLGVLVSDQTAQKLFPLVLVALVVPIAMLVWRKTRRFAEFMFLGIVSTAVVIAATAALVIAVLVKLDG